MTESFEYWYPWNPARYKSKTMHLTPEQDGIYRRLIDHYMETKSPLPEEHGSLARIVGCPIEMIEQNASSILDAFFVHDDGKYFHAHCNEILDDQDAKSRKRKRIASDAAKKRWSQVPKKKEQNASSMPDAMLQDARGQERTGQEKTGEEERGKGIDVRTPVELYNATANKIGIAQVQKLSATRKEASCGAFKGLRRDRGLKHALALLEASSFCKGNNDRGWKADFDFW